MNDSFASQYLRMDAALWIVGYVGVWLREILKSSRYKYHYYSHSYLISIALTHIYLC